MFPIRLTHPKHGAMHAHDHSEAERLKKQGWQEEAAPAAPKAPEVRTKRAYRRKAS